MQSQPRRPQSRTRTARRLAAVSTATLALCLAGGASMTAAFADTAPLPLPTTSALPDPAGLLPSPVASTVDGITKTLSGSSGSGTPTVSPSPSPSPTTTTSGGTTNKHHRPGAASSSAGSSTPAPTGHQHAAARRSGSAALVAGLLPSAATLPHGLAVSLGSIPQVPAQLAPVDAQAPSLAAPLTSVPGVATAPHVPGQANALALPLPVHGTDGWDPRKVVTILGMLLAGIVAALHIRLAQARFGGLLLG
jgi:hypothetical protein